MSEKAKFTGYMFIILAVFIWSLGEIVLKTIQDFIGIFSYTFLRMLFAGLFLTGILAFQRDFSGIGKMTKNNLALMIFTCCFALASINIFYYIGLSNTQANMAAVLCSTSPVWITILAFFILHERTNLKNKLIGIVIGVIGVTILLTELDLANFISSQYLFGNIMALGAEIMWSVYSVLGKRIQENENTSNQEVKFTAISFFLGAIPILVILILSPELASFLNYPMEVWIVIILLGVVFSGVAILSFFKGIKQVDTSKGASLIFLKPIFSTIFAFVILNEAPTIFLIVSSILIIISIYVINLNSKIEEKNK